MPGVADVSGGVRRLPEDYQKVGLPSGEETMSPEMEHATIENMVEFEDAAEIEELETATIENWLLDDTPVEDWVRLKTRPLKVKIKAMTEEQRSNIEKRAPKVPNKQTRKAEPDRNWINLELVRIGLVEPAINDPMMLQKALAGDVAYLAGEIGRLSGFDMGDTDASG